MHVRAIGALLGLFLALAAGGARAGASGGHGGRSPLPSIRLACQPDLVHAIVPGGAASVATAGVASSAGYNGYWDAPGSPHAWRGRSGGGRGGRMCRWSPKPRLNVDLTFQGINVLEQALANNDTSWGALRCRPLAARRRRAHADALCLLAQAQHLPPQAPPPSKQPTSRLPACAPPAPCRDSGTGAVRRQRVCRARRQLGDASLLGSHRRPAGPRGLAGGVRGRER